MTDLATKLDSPEFRKLLSAYRMVPFGFKKDEDEALDKIKEFLKDRGLEGNKILSPTTPV